MSPNRTEPTICYPVVSTPTTPRPPPPSVAIGIHRYLEAYPDGGYFKGLNYVFDRRESHGPEGAVSLAACVICGVPWSSYKGKRRCAVKSCRSLVLVCDDCQSRGKDRQRDGGPDLRCERCEGVELGAGGEAKGEAKKEAAGAAVASAAAASAAAAGAAAAVAGAAAEVESS